MTPPRRQASIWQKSMAPACMNCLNIVRFWQCSPVAIPIGATSRAMRGVAEDVVGAGRLLDPQRVELGERCIAEIACSTSQTWLASIISEAIVPISSRIERRPPHIVVEITADLHLEVRPALLDGARGSRRELSSLNPSQPAEVV